VTTNQVPYVFDGVIVEDGKDNNGNATPNVKTYHLRYKPTRNGEHEHVEHGKYFMAGFRDRTTADERGILMRISQLMGVVDVWGSDYSITVRIGKAFDWIGDGINEAVLQVVREYSPLKEVD